MIWLLQAALALIFLSKVAFNKLLPFIPNEFSFVLFQGGVHPFINVIFCAGISFVGLFFLKEKGRGQSPFFVLSCILILSLLIFQGILQSFLVPASGGFFAVAGATLGAAVLILLYGIIIPRMLEPSEILKRIWWWSCVLTIASLGLFLFAPALTFKGGRFTGVFKHIPHMVTVATLCFSLSFVCAQNLFLRLISLLGGGICLYLTGTRSSLAALVLIFVLATILLKSDSVRATFAKLVAMGLLVIGAVFFGPSVLQYSIEISKGEASIGQRQAQDGFSSRWEEVERGWEYFQKEPWTGYGLASKFASGGEASVDGYNSFKDPHNIFVSAGVTAGWPGLLLSFYLVALLTVGIIKSFRGRSSEEKIVAIYLAAHLPIMIIYHVHLSVGGIADRVYWLFFGILALQGYKVINYKKASNP